MYSYEDRIRAVKLYIKLGKRIAATIRQLGYPTKNALKSWHREYERRNDLAAGYVRLRPKYSAEQKKVAVEHYLSHGRCLAGTLRALGYPGRGTLADWVDELHPEAKKRVVGKAGGAVRPREIMQAAVIELCTREESARVVAQKVGVSRPTLYNWKNQLLGREVPASMRRHNDSTQGTERAELERQFESLRRDIRQLQLEHDILKKANELLKKGLGVAPLLLTNLEKTLLVDALRHTYTLSELLAELSLARSSYFYQRARLRRADKYAGVCRAIADIFELNHRCYGYRRMRAALARQQVFLSEKVVRRLMKQEGLTLVTARRRRYGSYERPVAHSDRGAHYRWPGWLSRIRDATLIRSMSRKGCSPDNAACEGFFGRLKTELFYPRDWRTTTLEQFIKAVDSYIRWYNEKRIKISLGSRSPVEYRESLGLADKRVQDSCRTPNMPRLNSALQAHLCQRKGAGRRFPGRQRTTQIYLLNAASTRCMDCRSAHRGNYASI